MGSAPENGVSSLLVESLQALESAVEGLYRLGIAIRQSSSGNLTQRINAFIKKKDDGMLEAMAFLHLKHSLVDRIKMNARATTSVNPEAPGAALSLCSQLAASVSFRYFGILYRRSHAEKLKAKREDKPKAARPKRVPAFQLDAIPEAAVGPITPSPARQPAQKPSALPATPRPAVAWSDTDASIPESEKARRVFASPQRHAKTAPSVISIRLRDVKYPDRPKMEPSARDQACPYCCNKFSRADFENETWWQ